MRRAFENIIIRPSPPQHVSGISPAFEPVVIGLEGVQEPFTSAVPFYIGKVPSVPPSHLGKAMEGFCREKKTLVLPQNEAYSESGVSVWSPLRQGIDAEKMRRSALIEMRNGEIIYDKDKPYALGHIEGKGDASIHMELLREATEYRLPIIVRITGGDIYKEVSSAVDAGADGVVVSVHDATVTAHPLSILGLFPPASKALHDSGARKKGAILLAEGEFHTGADVFKAMALGADMVGLTTPALEAVQAGAGALEKLFSGIEKECLALLGLSGHSSQKTLAADDLAAADYDTASITGLKLLGYEKELPIWLH
ncbi:MAG: alpha-hydroxy-acid oxidizing protein [Candidatus Thermoplasmatota archaeon]|nr:alpha-hydroxy-acid oxidizing protein [Candidatus Thermoplasmatota archaeon]